MKAPLQRVAKLLIGGLVVLAVTGCGMSNHKKNVNAANNRWKVMRSALMMQMAQQQFDAGDLKQAEKTLAEATKIDASNARLYTLAGRVALERGQLERAYHRLKSSAELDPDYAQAYFYQGIVMQRWTQFEAALGLYQKAYELESDNAGYLLAISEMLVMLDRSDEAMDVLIDKMTYFDLNASIRMAVGQLYAMRGEYSQAIEYFRQASLIRSDDLHIREELALSLLAAGQFFEAMDFLEKLCDEPSLANRADLKRALADSYLATGRLAEAKVLYLKLTRINPMDAEVWIKLGELSLSLNDAPGALLAANRAKKLAPERHEGFLLAGVVWSKQGEVEKAIEMFDQAADLAPDYSTPVLLRGITLEREGQLAEAAEAYIEALRRQPDDERAQQLLSKVTASVGENVLTGD